MYPQYMFEQKYENSQKKIQLKIVIFFSREKLLYIAWGCLRNDIGTYTDRSLIHVGLHIYLKSKRSFQKIKQNNFYARKIMKIIRRVKQTKNLSDNQMLDLHTLQ